jgi:DNA primase
VIRFGAFFEKLLQFNMHVKKFFPEPDQPDHLITLRRSTMDTSHIDLLELIGRDTPLKHISGTKGGEYEGPCPWCKGTNRVKVQPHRPGGGRWFCRKCGKHGANGPIWEDAIAYVKRRDGVDFREACSRLGLETAGYGPSPRLNGLRRSAGRPNTALARDDWVAVNDADWREAAARFMEQASACLAHSVSGRPGREYLRRRGLVDGQVLSAHNIGYNPTAYRAVWGTTEVSIAARSVIFPYIDQALPDHGNSETSGQPIKIKYRTIDRKDFSHARGSANGLFGISHMRPGLPIVLVEAEICALSLWQAAPGLVVPLATGSSDGGRLHSSVIRLSSASRIILAFDNDTEGDNATQWWQIAFPDIAVRLRPTRHDINDMLTAGDDIISWLKSVL